MEENKCFTCESTNYSPERCGSTAIEVVLWLYVFLSALGGWIYFETLSAVMVLFIGFSLPSVIYSLWRRTGRWQRCTMCGSSNVQNTVQVGESSPF